MRIFDKNSGLKFDEISLFLTRAEAEDLIGYLKGLLENKENTHVHVMSEDYEKEIMVCVYDSENIKSFNERVQKLIEYDE